MDVEMPLLRLQVEHDNKEWEQQGVLSNADLSHAEYGDLVIDWEKLDYASARTARQIANIAYTLVVRLLSCFGSNQQTWHGSFGMRLLQLSACCLP